LRHDKFSLDYRSMGSGALAATSSCLHISRQKVGGDDGFQRSVILGDALRRARARDNGSRGGMGKRELQRVRLSGYVVALRDRLDALDLGDNLRDAF
jgi:hypothetical protein